MSIERSHSPKYFEKRAEEFRAKANNAEHKQARDAMLKVAQTYDDLAQRAEKIRTVQDLAE